MASKAKQIEDFIKRWSGSHSETQEARSFLIDLLQTVLGVSNFLNRIEFEKPVAINRRSHFIDAFIPETNTIIEMKSSGRNLDQANAYGQAKEYRDNVRNSEQGRFIITSNFKVIRIYDLEFPEEKPVEIKLEELVDRYPELKVMIDPKYSDPNIHKINVQQQISVEAGDLVGEFYDRLQEPFLGKLTSQQLREINIFVVRVVFCLFAEDSGLFNRNQFHDYIQQYGSVGLNHGLEELFSVLNTPEKDRNPAYFDPVLLAFPYVNGGLFAEETHIPRLSPQAVNTLVRKMSEGFNWSHISPTIFGAVFESTLNPEMRRSGGMHYTSVENIHKVIDPLFLNELTDELMDIAKISNDIKRQDAALKFQDKLGSLKFLDPACGSGNFLTETYLSLRSLENEAIKLQIAAASTQVQINVGQIKVSINQFYGIEINDFAVAVATTALYIAEAQMYEETAKIVSLTYDFLPLRSFTNITEGNALRLDWNQVLPRDNASYVLGNPPFVGNIKLTDQQKEDRANLFHYHAGDLDYVACWYKKAAVYIQNTTIHCAFVSTNSICQGQQVEPLWGELLRLNIVINFAYRTFIWDSEASNKAHVYCVIIGFSCKRGKYACIYSGNSVSVATNINPYLYDAPDIIIKKRNSPLCLSPLAMKGLQPTDHGYLLLDENDRKQMVKNDPETKRWIRPFISAKEYLNGIPRYCLWLVDATPHDISVHKEIRERVLACKNWRSEQVKTGDAYKLRNQPALMRLNKNFSESDFIVIPTTTGERRRYVPMGYIQKGAIPANSTQILLGTSKYVFGVITSKVHMAWMRVTCGRLKGDYRYSTDITYNNFPWPNPTSEQMKKIEMTAQNILDVRDKFPDSSLVELYDSAQMHPDLLKAHIANDKAVMEAYGFDSQMTETEIVDQLMQMYYFLTNK